MKFLKTLCFGLMLFLCACAAPEANSGITQEIEASGSEESLAPEELPNAMVSPPDLISDPAPSPDSAVHSLPVKYDFMHQETLIVLDEDTVQLFADIGQPNKIFESPSCAFEGMDKILYYDGFYITTYPFDDKNDRIQTITLTDESAATPEGISLGMSFDAMLDAYGNGYDNMLDLYSYVIDDIKISFLFEDDALADITYYYLPVTNLNN